MGDLVAAADIPIRVWRVEYIERSLSTGEDSDSRVVWFESEDGFKNFIADAWLDAQLHRVTQTVIKSAYRVLVESYSPVEIDVGVKVRVAL